MDDLKRAPQRRETPVASVSIPAEWAQYVKGVTLTKTAAESGAFLTSPRLLYSQLTPSQEASLSATPAAHGFDPQFVSTHTPLPPAAIPVSQQVVILVMALLCFGVAWAVASSAVRELRRYLASLRAVGLPDGRLRGVVVRFAAVPPLVGIACGWASPGIGMRGNAHCRSGTGRPVRAMERNRCLHRGHVRQRPDGCRCGNAKFTAIRPRDGRLTQ